MAWGVSEGRSRMLDVDFALAGGRIDGDVEGDHAARERRGRRGWPSRGLQ